MREPKRIISQLATIAPMVAIEVEWSEDTDARWEGSWTKGEDRNGWKAWQSDVKATVIQNGKILTGTGSLGGTWEKFGEHPSDTNPDISGYFPQKLLEALQEIGPQLTKPCEFEHSLLMAIDFMKREIQDRYYGQSGTKK